jgi:hypothetical protein
MPAFAYIGAAVAASATGISIAATLGISAAVLGGIVAVGAAYITSRVINGNANKRNNSAANEGGRIQVPPATNNKIPVVYGSAYVNGIITDARLISLEQKKNDKMFYCIVLSEYTNNLTTPTYGLEAAYWNDLRLTPLDATSNAHIVKDGRKVVDGAIVTAGSFVPAVGSTPAKTYVITKLGNTTQAQWNTIAGTVGEIYAIGSIFTCANAGTGTGQAQEEDFIDKNFIVGTNQYVELRVYAGGSSAADQIYPPQSTGNIANAYNFWGSGGTLYPDGDGSWTTGNEMNGLVFAIVSVRYDNTKGFTGLPNMTFKLANNVSNPADVWKDYMTSERYGAGIPVAELDDTARTAWYNFCEEDITYTNVAGETNQATTRYSINGVIDTSNPVKTNIDTIMQNGGAWLSYNVATGLWAPVIKKAVSAGQAGETATYFTASRTGTTLTVTNFPSGRIEVGQLLYNSAGSYIGTITAQLTPTAGETAGQIGRYTTDSSGVISSTTFYTLPASTLEFSDDNIISGITISSTRLDDLYNSVEVEFYNKYNKDQKAYYRTSLDSADRNPNEPDNQLRMSLDLCNNSMQSDLIGQLELRQSRDDLTIEFTTNQYGIQTQSGDIIAVTSELYDWAPKYFRVMRVKEIETDEGGLIANIQALEYNPDVYTIEPITEFSTSANIGIGVFGASPNLPLPPSVIIAAVDADAPIPNFELQVTVPTEGGPFDEIELYYTEGWDEHGINGKIVEGQVAVTAATGNGSTATLTFATQTFTPYDVGQVVTIAGMTPAGYNGVKTITGATASTISYASTTTGAMTVAGTITNAAGAGLGLLTVTATTYGNINPGDRIDLPSDIYIVSQITNTVGPKTFSSGGVPASSTSRLITLTDVTGLIVGNTLTGTGIENGSFILEINPSGSLANTVRIEDAVTVQAAGTYTVSGGLGTYVVDTSVMASNVGGVAVNLFDFPEIDNYKPLKTLVPEGNTGSFTNGQVVRETVTNVPANSATYRRWFVKARMGIKKRYGEFSVAGDVDFEEGRFPYNPNPSGSGLPGSFGNITIAVVDANTISTTTGTLYINGAVITPGGTQIHIGDDADVLQYGYSSNTNNTLYTDHFIRGNLANRIYNTSATASTYPLRIEAEPGTGITPGVGYGVGLDAMLWSSDGVLYDGAPAGQLEWVWTDPTVGTEDCTLKFNLKQAGATTNVASLTSAGNLQIDGDMTVDGGNINLNGTATAGVMPFLTFATQADGANSMYGIRGMSTVDDPWFVGAGSTGNDTGYLEIATGDNAGQANQGGQIYVRQYNGYAGTGAPWYGGDGVVVNELVLLDDNGNTVIPKNLTVDSGTLFVDATNNRVGINNTSPSYELHIDNGSDTVTQFAMTNNERTFILTNNAADDLLSFNYGGANRLQFNTTNQWFNSGNTGINTATPAYTLDVNGTANIETSLTVPSISTLTGDDLNISAFSGRDINITATNGANGGGLTLTATTCTDPVTLVRNTANTNTSTRSLTLRTNSTGTPAVGFGNTLEFEIETAPAVTTLAGYIDVSATNVSSGSEKFEMNFGLRNGSTYTTLMNLDELGNLQIDGDLTVTGNNIKSSGGTTAITLSGADVAVAGDLTVTGNDIKSSTSATAITLSGTNVEVIGDLTVTGGDVGYASNRVRFETYNFNATTGSPTDVGIDLFSKTTYRSARYQVTMTKGSAYQVINLTIIHDGTTAYLSQSDDIKTGASDLATFSVSVDATDVILTANVNGTVNFKWYRFLTAVN